jgi:hypothetical protein
MAQNRIIGGIKTNVLLPFIWPTSFMSRMIYKAVGSGVAWARGILIGSAISGHDEEGRVME